MTIPILLLLLITTTTGTTSITLPLTQIHTTNPSQQDLHRLASASLSRAHKTPPSTSTTLSPHSYGGYSLTLSFGTPPQPLPFLLDTASDFLWLPCSRHYLCSNCSSSPSFIPKLSSSSRLLSCLSPKCSWAHHTHNPSSLCPTNSTQSCPPYLLFYGSGSTAGLPLLDTLSLPPTLFPNFLFGCSLFSSHQPSGIAAFGRGPSSLPTQLSLSKFSFCLLSHRLDDSNSTSSLHLVFAGENSHNSSGEGVSYTPFLKNPSVLGKSRFSVYYYVGLRRISVGGINVKIPYHYLAPPDPVTGSGGTIVDSGSTFTYVTRGIYGPLAAEFERQVKGYKRDRGVEELTGLGPCFDLLGAKTMSFPSVVLKFRGGAEMDLPLANYVALVGDAACLTVVTDQVGAEGEGGVGPAVILGNFQMQNFYVEFDLKNERFGFRKQKCG